jgi:hypothetical protein
MPFVHRLLLSCNLDPSDFRINGVALHKLMPMEQGIPEKTALPQLPSPIQALISVRPCSWGIILEKKEVFVLVARAFFWGRQVTKYSKKITITTEAVNTNLCSNKISTICRNPIMKM